MEQLLGYNERLWQRGIRRWIHSARFLCVARELQRYQYNSIFELGCFDGKLLTFLPELPAIYIGADAGLEGGLDLGQKTYPQFQFIKATSASDLVNVPRVDVSVCMETLEHLPLLLLGPYLKAIAAITDKVFIATVPVEFGPVFLVKHLAKRLVKKWRDNETSQYTLSEVMWATLGVTSKVRRIEHCHKGFDYRVLRKQISEHFVITRSSGHPFSFLPGWMNLGHNFICKPKQQTGTLPRGDSGQYQLW